MNFEEMKVWISITQSWDEMNNSRWSHFKLPLIDVCSPKNVWDTRMPHSSRCSRTTDVCDCWMFCPNVFRNTQQKLENEMFTATHLCERYLKTVGEWQAYRFILQMFMAEENCSLYRSETHVFTVHSILWMTDTLLFCWLVYGVYAAVVWWTSWCRQWAEVNLLCVFSIQYVCSIRKWIVFTVSVSHGPKNSSLYVSTSLLKRQ